MLDEESRKVLDTLKKGDRSGFLRKLITSDYAKQLLKQEEEKNGRAD